MLYATVKLSNKRHLQSSAKMQPKTMIILLMLAAVVSQTSATVSVDLLKAYRQASDLTSFLEHEYRRAVHYVLQPALANEQKDLWIIDTSDTKLSWKQFNEASSPSSAFESLSTVHVLKRQLTADADAWPFKRERLQEPAITHNIHSYQMQALSSIGEVTTVPVQRVLMVSWTTQGLQFQQSLSQGTSMTVHHDIWLTVHPQVMNFCQSLERMVASKINGNIAQANSLRLMRVLQYLGMPIVQNEPQRWMIHMWVDPKDLIRPCVGASVTDSKCIVTDVQYNPKSFKRPIIRNSSLLSQELNYEWVDTQVTRTSIYDYDSANVETFYPWTRSGYTFDWGGDGHGASEFVVKVGAKIYVDSIQSFETACAPQVS